MESMQINIAELTADPKLIEGEMEPEVFDFEGVEDIKGVLPLRFALSLQVLDVVFKSGFKLWRQDQTVTIQLTQRIQNTGEGLRLMAWRNTSHSGQG